MFAGTIDYPCAIADQTEEGAKAALHWARQHVGAGQVLTLWVAQRGILNNNEFLQERRCQWVVAMSSLNASVGVR